jgi:DNA modification methylase
MKLKDIKLNPSNPRVIKDHKFKQLVKSIQDFPEMLSLRPIVVNKEHIVLGGNMRLRACQEAKLKEVPVLIADELTPEQQNEFVIKDNVGFGEWDFEMLANEWNIEELAEWGLDVPRIDMPAEEEEEEEIDDVETIETEIEVGDLLEIGEHRLLCGNSFNAEAVAQLMNKEKASFVFTDPPYDITSEDYCKNIEAFTKDAHVFVMHDDKGIVNYLRKSQLEFMRFFVATFGFTSPRGNDPYLSHILLSHEKNGKAMPHKNMHDGFSSIVKMEYRGTLKEDETQHKHQKSTKFIQTFIEHYSEESAIVLDLFLGSGSTMLAAHKTKRKCFAMELEPKFCQLVIDRMRKHEPTIEVKRNGKQFN